MKSRTRTERLFDLCNFSLLGLAGFLALYPFLFTLSLSLSSAAEANRVGLHLFPSDISFTAYKMVLSRPEIMSGFLNSVTRTLLGVALTLFMTCLLAYPLARRETPHRSMLTFLVLFTMLFSGGLVPSYLLIRGLGLINSVWALTLPSMLSAFNVIIAKNAFQAVPDSYAEAARMDGASEWYILFRVYVPLSTPMLATIALWTAVAHWNNWFDALLYITDDHKQVLQVFLQRVVIESNTQMIEKGIVDPNVREFTPETIKAATVVVTVLPILLFYPFVQRYFVKGIMLGGVKE